MKILLVCTGNLCRSPMAAAVLAARLRDRGIECVTVESAGTLGTEGERADALACRTARQAGFDLSAHRARPLTADLLASSDLVLVMSRTHRERALSLAPEHEGVHLLGSFLDESARQRNGEEILDPIGGSPEEYRTCLDLIRSAVDGFLDRLESTDPGAAVRPPASEESAYFREIEERIRAARGTAGSLSSMEFHVVDRWWHQQVPLWLALDAIETAACRWPEGEAPRGLVRHADREVGARLEEAGGAVEEPVSSGAREETVGASLRQAAEEALRSAITRVDPSHRALRDALESAAQSLRSASDDPSALADLFDVLETRIAQAALSCLPAHHVLSLTEEERPRLRSLAAGMTPAALDETLRRLVRDRVFEQFSLPRLSLSYLASTPRRDRERS